MFATQRSKTGSYRHRPANNVATYAQYYSSSARTQICSPSVLAKAKPSRSKQSKANLSPAFKYYRVLVHNLLMRTTEVLRLADAERLAEQMWLAESWEMKARYAQLADNKPVQNQEQHPAPSMREPSCAPSSYGKRHKLLSPSPSPTPSDELEMPPTPRLRTCELPSSPSITSSPLPPLLPDSNSEAQELNLRRAREPSFDPYNEEPIIRHLADNWSSPLPTSSISLFTFVPEDEETWPYKNALGLYVDPAINVATWDAGGFIRSTAPSPSPSLIKKIRRET